jgi:glycosyltransferase involved in cell wall biosynthesis
MKVLYLANGLPHYFNLVLSKLNSMPDLEVVVVVPKGPGKYIGDGVFQTRQGTEFRIVELAEYSAWRFFIGFRGLPGLLLRERPAVVVLPEYLLAGFLLNPWLALAKKLVGAGLILKSIPFQVPDYATALKRVSAGRTPPASRLAKVLEALGVRRLLWRAALELRRYCFRMVDAHVNYVDAAREVYGSYGVAPERVFVTRNSPDTDAMSRTEAALLASASPPKRVPHRFLHVGRLVAQKRVDLLLDALPLVREKIPQAELVVVGDGPERAAFEQRAARLGIADVVRFVGPVYDPLELGRHFMSASAFVLPGLGGLSINEAMFYRLAVVCSSGDGTERFLVREGYNGAFFRADDRTSLAEAMIRLMDDQPELEHMGARSREIIDREVNIHTVIAGYLEAFRHACA